MLKKGNDAKILQWTCLRCGDCCKDKDIRISLTHTDLYNLFSELKTIKDLKKVLSIYLLPKGDSVNPDKLEKIKKQMFLSPLTLKQGKGYICLKKKENNRCLFLNAKNECNIYEIRPLACRNFPFYFKKNNDKIDLGFTKKALEICDGIGQGKNRNTQKMKQEGKKLLEVIDNFQFFLETLNQYQKEKGRMNLDEILAFALLYAEKEDISTQDIHI